MEIYTHREEQYEEKVKVTAPKISSLFEKYESMKLVPDGTLFGADMRIAVTQCRCPFCGNKIYLMIKAPMYFCKSKKHRNRFIISANKIIK